jgi:hypothetical protein
VLTDDCVVETITCVVDVFGKVVDPGTVVGGAVVGGAVEVVVPEPLPFESSQPPVNTNAASSNEKIGRASTPMTSPTKPDSSPALAIISNRRSLGNCLSCVPCRRLTDHTHRAIPAAP